MERRRTTTLGLGVLSVMLSMMAVAVVLWAVGSAGASPPMGPLAQGGTPLLLNYQGRLADPTTSLPKPDGAYTITFKVYNAQTDGSLIWSETQVVTVTRGLFNVLLGSSTALSASDFDGASRWLELEVEGETLSPRERMVSVPYAIQAEEAKNADTVDGFHASELGSDYQNVVVVTKSGGDYTSIQGALDSITDASASNPYLVWVAPGAYTETVTMEPYVDIEGAGELATKITYPGSGSTSTGTVVGASNAELRFLTVENTGGAYIAIAVCNGSASPRLTHITASASGGTEINFGVYNYDSSPTMTNVTATGSGESNNRGVYNYDSSPTMTNVTATASGGTNSNHGVFNGLSSPTMTDVTATASGGTNSYGVFNNTSSSPMMTDVTASASGGSYNYGVQNFSNSSPTMTDVTATASGGTNNYGVLNTANSSPTMTNVTAIASGGSYRNTGVDNSDSSPTMTDVTATASGGTNNRGVYNTSDSSPTMTNVTATASGGSNSYGVDNSNSSPTMTDVTATASGGTSSVGVSNGYSSATMTNITATASGGTSSIGVINGSSSPTIQNSVISASGGTTNHGIWNTADSGSYTVRVNNSQITGSTNTISNDDEFTTLVGASLLDGGAVWGGGTVTCAGVYDESYTFYTSTCP